MPPRKSSKAATKGSAGQVIIAPKDRRFVADALQARSAKRFSLAFWKWLNAHKPADIVLDTDTSGNQVPGMVPPHLDVVRGVKTVRRGLRGDTVIFRNGTPNEVTVSFWDDSTRTTFPIAAKELNRRVLIIQAGEAGTVTLTANRAGMLDQELKIKIDWQATSSPIGNGPGMGIKDPHN
jgi:hypothetical protein